MTLRLESAGEAFLPPGTQRIEDVECRRIVLSPVPTSDPRQPLNWPMRRKALHMTLLSTYAILVFAGLTVATPLWVNINLETGVSLEVLNYAYATSSGTLAVGCILFVPFALKFGRRPVYIATALLMTVSSIWQGRAHSTGDFIGSNVILGLAGAVNEASFQVTVSDMFFVHQRASANGLFLAAVTVGNYLGPVAAGYVAVSQGWRWVFYYLTMFTGMLSFALVFALEETKFSATVVDGQSVVSSLVLRSPQVTVVSPNSTRETEKGFKSHSESVSEPVPAQTATSSVPLAPAEDTYWTRHRLVTLDRGASSTSAKNTILRHIVQPFEILFRFPAVIFAALQYGWLVSMLSVVAVTQAIILPTPPYNFSAASVGLMSLPPAIGGVVGALVGGPLVDIFSVQIAKRRQGIHEPETRLWLFMIPGCSMVLGTLLYGLTIAKGMPWILNAIGAGFVGFALGGCGDMALTYLQDSYQHILGDALISVVFVRNAIATGLIFAVPPWMTNMGVYDMFVVCGVLAAFVAATSVPLVMYGRQWRVSLAGTYQKYASRQHY